MLDAVALRRPLLIAVAVVAALGLGAELWDAASDGAVVDAVAPVLSLSYEANLPTWFASCLLLACGLAAMAIAAAEPVGARWRRHWWAVAGVLTAASLDEVAELHEHLGGHLHTGGVLYFDWVIFAVAIVAALALAFLPFVRALPARTRRRLIVAGAVYLGGAVVMELPLGWWTDRAGSDNLGYALIDWVEETIELYGASLVLLALVDHRAATR
ncbi:MAG: hypothetical protein IPL61_01130 [Myxococcales bacterium]|nr:hypothetical protein [Myxococcales bacterium]